MKKKNGNEWTLQFADFEKFESQADFKAAYIAEELKRKQESINANYKSEDAELVAKAELDLVILKNEISKLDYRDGLDGLDIDNLTLANYSQ